MRILSWMTGMTSLVLSLPILLWGLGLSSSTVAMLHFCAFLIASRILFLAATVTPRNTDLIWMGGVAGVIGALSSQIVLHWPGATANLAMAFGAYGKFGAAMFRLDVFTWWWPYFITLWSGAIYAGVGLLMFHLAQWRHDHLTA